MAHGSGKESGKTDATGAVDPGRRAMLMGLPGGAALAAGLPLLARAVERSGPPPIAFPPRLRPGAGLDATLPILDPINDIKAVFDAGVSLIPLVGGPLRIFMDLFWPVNQQELSALLLQRMQALVDTAIQKTTLDNLANLLGHPAGADGSGTPATGLNGAYGVYLGLVDAYRQLPSASNRDDVRTGALTLHTTFTTMAGSFAPGSEPFPDWQQQILPYFAQFANLHLVFLRDLVWHGTATGVDGKPGYGFDDGGAGSTMDQFRSLFHVTRDQYVEYATNQIAAIAVDLENNYQSNRGKYEDHGLAGAYCWQPSLIATGAWYAKKKQNVTNSLMIHLVQDYRDLWKVMDDPAGGKVDLTRELWFGPYGAPSLQDIGLPNDGSGAAPDVPSPPTTPGAPLSYVAASTGALITRDRRDFNFVSALTTFRQGQAVDLPPYNSYGISLADQYGGPIIGVKVDIGRFDCYQTDEECYPASFTSSSGYLVSQWTFTQKSGFTSGVGNDYVGYEMKSYEGNPVDVPTGHMLSSVFVPSTVYELYRYVGKTPTDLTYHSVGSVMFGFRMMDPSLNLSTSLLKSLYVASPQALSLDDVHQVLLQAYARKGSQVSPQRVAELLEVIRSAAERYRWDEQRWLFLRRTAAAGS